MTKKQGRILIVDDEEVVRRLLHRKLSSEGYQCQEAGSADQALDKLRSNTVELVILDIKMPGKSGVELLPEIKASYPDTAVIMATAVTDTDTAIQCMKQGAYDYITKPFKLDEVMLGVDRALEKRRLELENRDYQQHLEQKVEEQAKRIRAAFLNAITALVYALEAKDKYTSGHSQRVAEISVAVAKELGMPDDSIERIRLAGLIHDIGKIGVRESVLNKSGKLSDEEYWHIISHCDIGERILSPIVEDKEILKMVRHHHERYDGSGYPDGLSGKQISRGAKILAVAEAYVDIAHDHTKGETLSQDTSILAVADAYDAMTSDRSYRTALTVEQALEEIRQGIGTQFDPVVANTFLKMPVADRVSTTAIKDGKRTYGDGTRRKYS
jgi:putative nucleotidyltransferase with HDIG domain